MVVGRLNKESNPVKRERAGFTPQHKLPDGSFIDTGETNPLPTNDDLVLAKLAEMDTKIGATNSRLNGVLDTNLVGAVSDNMLSELKKISGSFGAEDLWGTPGNQKLVEGDKDAGFFGFVTAADFINGDDLAAAIGLSAGASQFSDTPWLKYMWKGKVCFTPLKTIRRSIDWDSIYNVGAVYASGDEGTLPPEGRLGTELTIGAADNSINTAGHFLGDKTSTTDYYDTVGAVGDTIVLDGWANAGNNGEFVIDSITDSKIVVSGGILVSEVGDRTNRLYPKANVVTQNTSINLKGFDFNVRLFSGADNDPLNSFVDADRDSVGAANEWNNIILPLHERAISQNWIYPNYAGTTESWRIYLSDADLMTHVQFGNGSYSWCQEVRDDTQTFRRVYRGASGASGLYAIYSWDTKSSRGWRPVLQLS